ncbi:MAG TPA: MMPL family transporter, partial [Pirellulaceae bacterium]
ANAPAPHRPEANDAAPQPAENTTPASVRQDVIFLRTLAYVLQNSAITCKIVTDAKLLEEWQSEPSENDTEAVRPNKKTDRLDDFDCVVLTSPNSEWKQASRLPDAPSIVDATDFRFDPHEELKTARAKDWPVTVSYTGLVPVVYKAQRTLLNSLIKSTWSAFISIALTMILVLRSIPAGTLAMIPNLFPVVVVFGVMGFTNVKIDIGTMMTASIALGIAVDDTVHYLTWFRRALDKGLDRHAAILDSFGRCASSMTETALIAGLGLSVFGFSTFTPTKRFGILMLVILVTGVVGELIMTTALLAGPAGRIFEPRRKGPGNSKGAPASPSVSASAASDPVPPAPHPTPTATEMHPHTKFLANLTRIREAR